MLIYSELRGVATSPDLFFSTNTVVPDRSGTAFLWCYAVNVKAGAIAAVTAGTLLSRLEYLKNMFIGAFDSQGIGPAANGVSYILLPAPLCPTDRIFLWPGVFVSPTGGNKFYATNLLTLIKNKKWEETIL